MQKKIYNHKKGPLRLGFMHFESILPLFFVKSSLEHSPVYQVREEIIPLLWHSRRKAFSLQIFL